MSGTVRAIDLSHEIADGMVTHPGIRGPVISTFLTHEASVEKYAPMSAAPASTRSRSSST